MKEKRHRLNFKQSAKGVIQFDGTVEIINPVGEHDENDVAVETKSAADKLAQETLELLQAAEKKFKDEASAQTIATKKTARSCIW